MRLQDILEFYGNATRAAGAAQKRGMKWQGQTILKWIKRKKELSPEKKLFFATIIKEDAEKALKIANDVLSGENGDL